MTTRELDQVTLWRHFEVISCVFITCRLDRDQLFDHGLLESNVSCELVVVSNQVSD